MFIRHSDILLSGPYRVEAGHCYRASYETFPFAHKLAALSDSNDQPQRSPTMLLENGKEIGVAHAPHRQISASGGGLFSHWGATVYFSSSDNSNPNENGRSYALRVFRDFDHEERLELRVKEFLLHRMAELGQEKSGFYEYYARLSENDSPFPPYDKVIKHFLQHSRPYQKYVEVGAGIAQLGVLLAADGFKTFAIEGDSLRKEAAIALQRQLSSEFEEVSKNLTIIEAFFPTPLVEIDQSTMVIFTNIIHSAVDFKILDACRNAGAIILDMCRFGYSRTTTREWQEIIRYVRNLGFPYVDPLLSWGQPTPEPTSSPSSGRFVHFYREARLR